MAENIADNPLVFIHLCMTKFALGLLKVNEVDYITLTDHVSKTIDDSG